MSSCHHVIVSPRHPVILSPYHLVDTPTVQMAPSVELLDDLAELFSRQLVRFPGADRSTE
jgi:hypothetical protein